MVGVAFALILGTAAPIACLPPDVPPVAEMREVGRQFAEAEGLRPTEHYLIAARLYVASDGHRYVIDFLFGRSVIVDDHPDDPSDTAWWIDPDVITDDIPPRVKGPDLEAHCAWRRRADAT